MNENFGESLAYHIHIKKIILVTSDFKHRVYLHQRVYSHFINN